MLNAFWTVASGARAMVSYERATAANEGLRQNEDQPRCGSSQRGRLTTSFFDFGYFAIGAGADAAGAGASADTGAAAALLRFGGRCKWAALSHAFQSPG
ncbi:unnamed protein product [uncultured bacterium]|nr:unnamed protein product [uncultured bacterium]